MIILVLYTSSLGITHINLRPYSARNAQLLGQIDVGTVSILFDRVYSTTRIGNIWYMEPGPAHAEILYVVLYRLALFSSEITVHAPLTEHRALRHKLKSCTVPILYCYDLVKSGCMLYRPGVCNCTMPYVPRTVPAYAVRDPAYTAEVFALTLVEIDVGSTLSTTLRPDSRQ